LCGRHWVSRKLPPPIFHSSPEQPSLAKQVPGRRKKAGVRSLRIHHSLAIMIVLRIFPGLDPGNVPGPEDFPPSMLPGTPRPDFLCRPLFLDFYPTPEVKNPDAYRAPLYIYCLTPLFAEAMKWKNTVIDPERIRVLRRELMRQRTATFCWRPAGRTWDWQNPGGDSGSGVLSSA
jgi:hypothetical protein